MPAFGRDRHLKAEGTRFIRGGRRTLLAVFASVLLASCATSDSDVPFGFATAEIAPVPAQAEETATATPADNNGAPLETASTFVVEEGDPVLPDSVASAPVLRPGSEALALAAVPATPAPQPLAAAAQPAAEEHGSAGQAIAAAPDQPSEAPLQIASLVAEPAAQPKKRGFLSAFFSPSPAAAQPVPAARPLIDPAAARPATASAAAPSRPLVQLAATGEPARPLVGGQPPAADANALPGVRPESLFEITRRSGLDDDSDIDLHEGDEPPYQVASAAGLARLAPNGLMKQTDHVDVACLKPSLVRVLKAVEKHYGRKIVVTSGYRSPDKNRRARGARNSLHMYCAAADVQVEGVSKWDLAQFVRTMPGRGGVGTYCHTDSVHIDVGPERDWNWRCRRRK